jgi:hypothetical protein
MGITSKSVMQSKIVCVGDRRKKADKRDHRKAPNTPKTVAMTFIRASIAYDIPSVVFAKSTAVPDTVAILSERRNHAARKSKTSLRCRACVAVRPRDFHEYVK